jgi:starvation-inducible DNA-binding protein
LHELFGTQYDQLALAVDEIAERIRVLGPKIEANFGAFDGASKVKNGNKNFTATEMLKDLAASHKIVVKLLKEGTKISQKHGDEAVADLLITRTEAHEKDIWMIESSIG